MIATHARWRTRWVEFLQRSFAWLPPPIRALGRGIVHTSSAVASDPVEGWCGPLIDRRPHQKWTDWPTGLPLFDSPRQQNQTGDPGYAPLRCILATESIDVGGMDEVVAFLARRLPELGIDVSVVHAPINPAQKLGRLGEQLRVEGVHVVDLKGSELKRWMVEFRADVMSVHGAPDSVIQMAADLSVPAVETLHGMHTLFDMHPDAVAARSQLVAGIVAVSELVRAQYLHLDGSISAERVLTIPNGVDTQRLARVSRAKMRDLLGLEDEFLFVSLSRHCLQKNTYGIAAAFDDVSRRLSNVHLVIAGRADDRQYASQVSALKDRMRWGDRLHLRDHADSPSALLAAADGFVLDSFFEGWALASMEALGARCTNHHLGRRRGPRTGPLLTQRRHFSSEPVRRPARR